MNNIVLWIVGLLVVLCGGYLAYERFGTGAAPSGAGETMEESGAFEGTLAELAERGGSYKCVIDHESAGTESSGTVYVSGSDIRGDFTSTAGGMAIETHMIRTGSDIYVWSPIAPSGFKMKSVEGNGDAGAAMEGQFADMQQRYRYSCETWTPDGSLFSLPAGVTFTAIN